EQGAAVGGLVERAAGEGGLQGQVGQSPEAEAVEDVHDGPAHLERVQGALAGVERGQPGAGGEVVGDQRGRPLAGGPVEDVFLVRLVDGRRAGKDLAGPVVADDEVLLGGDDDQERRGGDAVQGRLPERLDLARQDGDDRLRRRQTGLARQRGELG